MDAQDGQDSTNDIFETISGKAFVFQLWISKIDEQSDFDTCGINVIYDLRAMDGRYGLSGFQLDDDPPLYKNVYKKLTAVFLAKQNRSSCFSGV